MLIRYNFIYYIRNGNTLLLVAAQNGLKGMAKIILLADADINASNSKLNTALHFCHAYGFVKLATFLMKQGADDTIQNIEGLTCYEGLSMANI